MPGVEYRISNARGGNLKVNKTNVRRFQSSQRSPKGIPQRNETWYFLFHYKKVRATTTARKIVTIPFLLLPSSFYPSDIFHQIHSLKIHLIDNDKDGVDRTHCIQHQFSPISTMRFILQKIHPYVWVLYTLIFHFYLTKQYFLRILIVSFYYLLKWHILSNVLYCTFTYS